MNASSRAILLGRRDAAISRLRPVVRAHPADLAARGLLALALYASGRHADGDAQVYALRRLDPVGRQTAFLVARHLLGAFRWNAAVVDPLLNLVTGQHGANRFLWLAQTFQDRGFYADAVTVLVRGVARYPASVPLLDALGFNCWKSGRRAAALTAYGRAIRLAPRTAGLYVNAGWVYFGAHRYADAASAWRAALVLGAPDPAVPGLIRAAERRQAWAGSTPRQPPGGRVSLVR